LALTLNIFVTFIVYISCIEAGTIWRVGYMGHVTSTMKTRKLCKILVRKSLVKRPQGSARKNSEGNIRIELRERNCEDTGGREVTQDRVHQ